MADPSGPNISGSLTSVLAFLASLGPQQPLSGPQEPALVGGATVNEVGAVGSSFVAAIWLDPCPDWTLVPITAPEGENSGGGVIAAAPTVF